MHIFLFTLHIFLNIYIFSNTLFVGFGLIKHMFECFLQNLVKIGDCGWVSLTLKTLFHNWYILLSVLVTSHQYCLGKSSNVNVRSTSLEKCGIPFCDEPPVVCWQIQCKRQNLKENSQQFS